MSNSSHLAHIRGSFFGMLQKAGVSSRSKYNELDIDFSNIEGFSDLSVGDTKQLYSEYQSFAFKQEKEEARINRKQAKEDLHNFLDEFVNEFDPEMTFRQFAAMCVDKPFWTKLDLEEIESIFQDFVEDFEDKYMYKVKERHFQLKRDCFNFLNTSVFSNCPIEEITCERANQAIVSNELFTSLDELDRFDVYEDLFRDRVEEIQAKKRQESKRIARKRRQAFVASLEARKSEIVAGIKWHEFIDKTSEAYLNLIGTRNSSQPYDLFAEYRSRWKREDL